MSTKREQVLQAVIAALTGTVQVGSRIYRSRSEPITRGQSPAIIIEPVIDRPSQPTIGYLQWELTVRISVYVRGAVPDQLADPIVADIHQRLFADTTLGGVAQDIMPSQVGFQIEEADQPAGLISCDYTVMYRTRFTDVTLSS